MDVLVISHEHEDHYWALRSTLKRYQNIPMVIPNTFYPEGKAMLKPGNTRTMAHVWNDIPHTGALVEVSGDKSGNTRCTPASPSRCSTSRSCSRPAASKPFLFNIKDKGIVSVTGLLPHGDSAMLILGHS